jgi:hypothetical protein
MNPRLCRAFSLPVPAWSQMPVFGFKESSWRGFSNLKPNTKEKIAEVFGSALIH